MTTTEQLSAIISKFRTRPNWNNAYEFLLADLLVIIEKSIYAPGEYKIARKNGMYMVIVLEGQQ